MRLAFIFLYHLFVGGGFYYANLNSTSLDELGLPASIGGYTRSIVGISGMVAGFITGRIADKMEHAIALLVIFSCLFMRLLSFIYDPTRFAFVAGFGCGMMCFPVLGILADSIRQHYSSTATMQISSDFRSWWCLRKCVNGLYSRYYGLTGTCLQ